MELNIRRKALIIKVRTTTNHLSSSKVVRCLEVDPHRISRVEVETLVEAISIAITLVAAITIRQATIITREVVQGTMEVAEGVTPTVSTETMTNQINTIKLVDPLKACREKIALTINMV